MTDERETAKIKGIAFIEVLRWYAQTHGQAKLRYVTRNLSPDLKYFITKPEADNLGLLPASWYPARLIQGIFREMTADLSPVAVRALATDAANAAVGNTLKGIYGTFLKLFVNPTMIADHYQRIWRLYQNVGFAEVIIHGPTHHEVRVSDWSSHDPFLCLMVAAATRVVLEVAGYKHVTVTQLKCVGRGDPHCAYVQKWST